MEKQIDTIIDNYVTRYGNVPPIIYVGPFLFKAAQSLPHFPFYYTEKYSLFIKIEYGGQYNQLKFSLLLADKNIKEETI